MSLLTAWIINYSRLRTLIPNDQWDVAIVDLLVHSLNHELRAACAIWEFILRESVSEHEVVVFFFFFPLIFDSCPLHPHKILHGYITHTFYSTIADCPPF